MKSSLSNNRPPVIHALMLAAGEGVRLRPVTCWIPKPLLPLADRPLLEIVLANLRRAGVSRFAINTHHLAERLEAQVMALPLAKQIQVYHERELLGTGGPLVNARDLLAEADLFLLHNGDILTDFDLRRLVQAHRAATALVTMVLFDGPENRVRISPEGTVCDLLGRLGDATPNCATLTYAGVAAFSPRIFMHLPDQPTRFSLVEALLPLIATHPGAVRGFHLPTNAYWSDVGTVDKYLAAAASITAGRCRLPRRLGNTPAALTQLAPQGSNRSFHRLQVGAESMVLMRSNSEDADFTRFLEIDQLLHEHALGAPQIHAVHPTEFTVLMEDLGDETLCRQVRRLRRKSRSWASVTTCYRRVLDHLATLQVRGGHALATRPAGFLRAFDHAYLRWETDYFRDRFLVGWAELPVSELDQLTPEFEALAQAALAQPQVLIHRDFQSQNLILQDRRVRLVDFQGARLGQVAYDLMSLVRDPYVALPGRVQRELIEYFRFALPKAGGPKYPAAQFAQFTAVAGLQRSMQALGAYGFLALVKGKLGYLRFIPPGLRMLCQGLRELHALPQPPCRLPHLEHLLKSLPTIRQISDLHPS